MGGTPLEDLRADIAARPGGGDRRLWRIDRRHRQRPGGLLDSLLEDGVAYCEGLLGPNLPPGWTEIRRAARLGRHWGAHFGRRRHRPPTGGPDGGNTGTGWSRVSAN